jgi:hypothetical protein
MIAIIMPIMTVAVTRMSAGLCLGLLGAPVCVTAVGGDCVAILFAYLPNRISAAWRRGKNDRTAARTGSSREKFASLDKKEFEPCD